MSEIIVMRGVGKSYGKHRVLDNLDLSVERGTIFALLGPNGAGKTTVVNILSTLVTPDTGTATVAGHDVVREREAVKRSISLTGQSAAVDEVLTGAENLRLMGTLAGLGRAESKRRSTELLERFELTEAANRRAKNLLRRDAAALDLAISLLTTPPVILLDEPTTGLDTRSRQELWGVIRGLADNGTTVFITTQYLEEADQLADRIAVLDDGAIVAEGTPGELKARVGGEVVALHGADGEVVREIPTDGTVDGLRAALDGIAGDESVSLRRPSLDDVFLAFTNPKGQ